MISPLCELDSFILGWRACGCNLDPDVISHLTPSFLENMLCHIHPHLGQHHSGRRGGRLVTLEWWANVQVLLWFSPKKYKNAIWLCINIKSSHFGAITSFSLTYLHYFSKTYHNYSWLQARLILLLEHSYILTVLQYTLHPSRYLSQRWTLHVTSQSMVT